MKLKNIGAVLTALTGVLFPVTSKAQQEGIPLEEVEAWFYKSPVENATGKTVLILPGGGYTFHAMDHEGREWVPFFNDRGINVAILKYKLPEGNYEIPLADVKKTFELLQAHAREWNVDPADIGIMGFSAGGHLASAYATHSEGSTRPAFQILFYPVISLKEGLTHQGSKDALLGKNPDEELVLLYSGEEQVTDSTPRAILFHSNDDTGVVTENSVNYYMALRRAGVPASLHIYPSGGHGWGMRAFPYHDTMLEDLSAWLTNENP